MGFFQRLFGTKDKAKVDEFNNQNITFNSKENSDSLGKEKHKPPVENNKESDTNNDKEYEKIANLLKKLKFGEAYELLSKVENNKDLPVGLMEFLGDFYFEGKVTAKNVTKAIKFYKRAAKLNNPHSTYMLGKCYLGGIGVRENEKLGYSYVKKASDLGVVNAYTELALCHAHGAGVSKNYQQAISYLKKGADKKVKTCLLMLAKEYYKKEEYKDALKYYTVAANEGSFEGMYTAGLQHYRGEGTDVDYKKARYWFKKITEGNVTGENIEYMCDALNALVHYGLNDNTLYLPSKIRC